MIYNRAFVMAFPPGINKASGLAAALRRLGLSRHEVVGIGDAEKVCIIDPEGDYSALRSVIAIGSHRRAASVNEVLSILEDPVINLSVNLLGLPLEDRPFFFAQLIPALQAMRARTGRPHWIVLDEAHHMLPQTWGHAESTVRER